jgi:hypothetical protein
MITERFWSRESRQSRTPIKERPMPSSTQEIALRLVEEGFEQNNGEESLGDIHQLIAATEARIVDLERDLTGVTEQEAETARQLETRRARRTVLDRQLGDERKKEARLRLEESIAAQTAVLVDAENEASQITKQAREEADEILAESKRESAAIVGAGRERLGALEEDAARRAVELDAEHQARSDELRIMETLYDELQSTLKLVAETSIKRLVDTQSSFARLDPTEREQPVTGEDNDRPTDERQSLVDADTSSTLLDSESAPGVSAPRAVSVPPLSRHRRPDDDERTAASDAEPK